MAEEVDYNKEYKIYGNALKLLKARGIGQAMQVTPCPKDKTCARRNSSVRPTKTRL